VRISPERATIFPGIFLICRKGRGQQSLWRHRVWVIDSGHPKKGHDAMWAHLKGAGHHLRPSILLKCAQIFIVDRQPKKPNLRRCPHIVRIALPFLYTQKNRIYICMNFKSFQLC